MGVVAIAIKINEAVYKQLSIERVIIMNYKLLHDVNRLTKKHVLVVVQKIQSNEY